jgi:acyl carrier protein
MKTTEELRDEVENVIYKAMLAVNELLPQENKLAQSKDEILSGPDSKLDSLGYVNFLAALGQEYEEEFGFSPAISGNATSDDRNNPFRTVETLVDYLLEQYTKRHEDFK